MYCIYRVCFVALASSTVVIGAFVTTATAPQRQDYPGQVLEARTNRPLAVSVKAWPSVPKTADEGGCPTFGSAPLDSTDSNGKDGQYTLRIDPRNSLYNTTYCANGYYPQRNKDLSSADPKVMPVPVEMAPRKPNNQLDSEYVRMKTVSALNSLAYLRSINPEQFDNLVRDIPRANGLAAVVRDWDKD